MTRTIVLLISAVLYAGLAGCASTPEEPPTDKELYEQAKEAQDRADYQLAQEKFDELVATYPASAYAQQGLLDVAFLHYQRGEYRSSRDAADRFLLAYPDHESASYALYLKGLAFFQEDQNLVDRLGFQDPTERNPESMRQAFAVFKQLVEQYPESSYAEDASLRMRYLISALALGESHVARYYLRRKAPLAAIGRAKSVLENYPDSSASEDVLEVLARAYHMMGAYTEMNKALKLLEFNYPDNEALNELREIGGLSGDDDNSTDDNS